MGKIEEYIQGHALKPSDTVYHTNRSVEGGKGRIRVLVLKSDNIARVEYKCMMCGNDSYTEQEWKKPFSIKCGKCSTKISVPKLKDQFKREMKKANAEKA